MNRASPSAAAQTALLVEPTSVTTQPSGATAEHLAHDVGKLGHRRRDQDEVGTGDGVGERRDRVDGLALLRGAEDVGVGVPAAHRGAGPARGERRRRADQSRPDDGDVPEHVRAYPRISSATRNARSSD